jgi:NIPSNAP
MRCSGITIGLVSIAFGLGVYVGGGVPVDAQRPNRVLEVRRYTAAAGKLDELVKRMREGETALFEKHGMKGVFYSVAAEAPDSQNTYLYVLAHQSREAAKKSWDDFRGDPAWKSLRDTSEANGPLVSKAESIFVSPTDFSPLK